MGRCVTSRIESAAPRGIAIQLRKHEPVIFRAHGNAWPRSRPAAVRNRRRAALLRLEKFTQTLDLLDKRLVYFWRPAVS